MKVYVDELPETCSACLFYNEENQKIHILKDSGIVKTNQCILTKLRIPITVASSMRLGTDCPLAVLENK